jgi:hypothetical protein
VSYSNGQNGEWKSREMKRKKKKKKGGKTGSL